jgi:hypothetical protein
MARVFKEVVSDDPLSLSVVPTETGYCLRLWNYTFCLTTEQLTAIRDEITAKLQANKQGA